MTTAAEIHDSVRAGGLLAAARPVVVMLSGGRDSTCLLDLAVTIAGPQAVSVLHVNYGLRDAARGDERLCAELCARYGVPLDVRRPVAPTLGNRQAWARDNRYGAAAQIAVQRGGADVAAGHTATDQVETILYRLASSPSRRALLGMRPREGALVRPLLGFTREETGDYCRERGLPWRDDESNDSDRYARNRIRHALVPVLRDVHPAAERNVLALAELLRDEGEVLDALVAETLNGRSEIELERLRALPVALARLLIQQLADRAIGRAAPGTARRLDDVLALGPAGALDLPHGVRANVRDRMLSFGRTPPLTGGDAPGDPSP
jgi:tRNA(Ile)-lysidine synthase